MGQFEHTRRVLSDERGLPDGTGVRVHRRESVRSWAMRVSSREELVTGSTIVALVRVSN
jgi:hypothetical protein